MMRKKPSKEELEFYYWVLGYSIPKIAEIFGVHRSAVEYWMNKYGILRRPRDLAISIAKVASRAVELEETVESIRRKPEILDIIDGLLLSDASIHQTKTGSVFEISVVEDHADWICWIRDQFELVGLRCSISKRVLRIGRPQIRLRSSRPLFKIERDRWYPHEQIFDQMSIKYC